MKKVVFEKRNETLQVNLPATLKQETDFIITAKLQVGYNERIVSCLQNFKGTI